MTTGQNFTVAAQARFIITNGLHENLIALFCSQRTQLSVVINDGLSNPLTLFTKDQQNRRREQFTLQDETSAEGQSAEAGLVQKKQIGR